MEQYILAAKAKALGVTVDRIYQLLAEKMVADESCVEHDLATIVMNLSRKDLEQ